MTFPEALVERLSLDVRSDDRGALVEAPKALERATRDALVAVAQTLGDEVLVVRHVRVDLSAASLGPGGMGAGSSGSELSAVIGRSLRRQLARSGAPTDAAWADESLARYSSEAVACAERLVGLLSGTSEQWPRRALKHFGSSVEAVFDYAVRRSRTFAGATLAHVVDTAAWPHLLGSSPLVERVSFWIEEATGSNLSEGNRGAAGLPRSSGLSHIPPDVLDRARSAARHVIRKLEQASADPMSASRRTAMRRLALLGELFRHWPPARDGRVKAAELDELLENEAVQRVLLSRAGGLVFWALQIEELELAALYAEPRQLKAVRWAIARTLENAALPQGDPMLALFAGETAGATLAIGATLQQTDTEPLLARALRLVPSEDLSRPVRIVPFGDDAVVMVGPGTVLDSIPGTSPEEAIPEFVRRFRTRLNRSPFAVETQNVITSADVDTIAAADSVSLPVPWQHALRTVVSVLFRSARVRFNAVPQVLHGWDAAIANGEAVELRRVDVVGLAEGSWLPPSVRLGGADYAVVVR